MSNYQSLQHIFLIAMPQLTNTLFSQSVVYLWEYNEKGATGIIINKPMNFRLGDVLKQLEITIEELRANDYPISQGGPVAVDQGFIVRRRQHLSDENGKPMVEITVSSSKEDLMDMARGDGLGDCLVALGCAGWEAGQLDRELANNDWLIAPFSETTLFSILSEQGAASPVDKWHHAAASVGVDFNRLSSDIGHA